VPWAQPALDTCIVSLGQGSPAGSPVRVHLPRAPLGMGVDALWWAVLALPSVPWAQPARGKCAGSLGEPPPCWLPPSMCALTRWGDPPCRCSCALCSCALLLTQCWQQFLDSSAYKNSDNLPFFDRLQLELEKEDIGPGPSIMEISLPDPHPAPEIISVKPPETKDGELPSCGWFARMHCERMGNPSWRSRTREGGGGAGCSQIFLLPVPLFLARDWGRGKRGGGAGNSQIFLLPVPLFGQRLGEGERGGCREFSDLPAADAPLPGQRLGEGEQGVQGILRPSCCQCPSSRPEICLHEAALPPLPARECRKPPETKMLSSRSPNGIAECSVPVHLRMDCRMQYDRFAECSVTGLRGAVFQCSVRDACLFRCDDPALPQSWRRGTPTRCFLHSNALQSRSRSAMSSSNKKQKTCAQSRQREPRGAPSLSLVLLACPRLVCLPQSHMLAPSRMLAPISYACPRLVCLPQFIRLPQSRMLAPISYACPRVARACSPEVRWNQDMHAFPAHLGLTHGKTGDNGMARAWQCRHMALPRMAQPAFTAWHARSWEMRKDSIEHSD